MLAMDEDYNWPFSSTICDGLTPFQASVGLQESSAIGLLQHFAGNWIDLRKLKHTTQTLRKL